MIRVPNMFPLLWKIPEKQEYMFGKTYISGYKCLKSRDICFLEINNVLHEFAKIIAGSKSTVLNYSLSFFFMY